MKYLVFFSMLNIIVDIVLERFGSLIDTWKQTRNKHLKNNFDNVLTV